MKLKCTTAENCCKLLAMLIVTLALIATVASVPTSVLVQNSELGFNQHNNNNAKNTPVTGLINKVKRSSNSVSTKDMTKSTNVGTSTSDAASTSSNGGALDKKSSPEVVPASFVPPPPPQSSSSAAQQSSAGGVVDDVDGSQHLSGLPNSSELLSSAIAAGLTAAAVEAAAAAAVAAGQREKQQRQLYEGNVQQSNDDDMPTMLYKRGITPQQLLYGQEESPALDSSAIYGGGVSGGADSAGGPYGVYNYGIPNDGYGYYSNGATGIGNSYAAPNGVWLEELDPAMSYGNGYGSYGSYGYTNDIQNAQQDDYVPPLRSANAYRSKAYDNLQNLLNSEAAYIEQPNMAVAPTPLRYYNSAMDTSERNKRTSSYNINGKKLNKYSNDILRSNSKRDSTKLTPADMLALVALVEAGERARQEDAAAAVATPTADSVGDYASSLYGGDVAAAANYNPRSYYGTNDNVYDYTSNSNSDDEYNPWNWLDQQQYSQQQQPSALVDYYGIPMNMESMPKYELARGNRYAAKRFMVSKKKKRSLAKPSTGYNNNFINEKF